MVHCEVCRGSLVATTPSTVNPEAFILLTVKNNGGLVTPSDGVITVICSAERHLRNLTEISRVRSSCSLLRLQCLVLEDLGSSDVLSLQAHATETVTQLDNHYTDIIRLIVEIYFTTRIHHIARLHNLVLQGKQARQKYTKLVLFKGQ